jgi:adenosyl cobinamide kinase/adenosyl cobinamide phosphate guanylyltransferase
MRDIRELFPTDDPVDPSLLIGRTGDLEDVASRLAAGTHIVMTGPRRTGKSSLALAALAQLEARGHYTAKVDLWDHDDLASLTTHLAQAILANRNPVAKALSRAREGGRELRELLPTSLVATLRTHLGEDVELAWGPPAGHRAKQTQLGATLALAQRIAARDKRRIVLFLDEFQDIASSPHRFGNPDVLTKQMRAQLQRSPMVSVLFAGSVEHMMRDLFGPTRRALSQFGNFHALSPIHPTEWHEGIGARYRELKVRAAKGSIEQIVTLGEGHPRTTMLIARETLTVTLTRPDSRTVENGDVRGGYELAMQADRLRHEEIVERLRSTAYAYATALRVARGQRPYSGTPSASARRSLTMMERAGIAERRGRGDWVIPEPLMRAYLAGRP